MRRSNVTDQTGTQTNFAAKKTRKSYSVVRALGGTMSVAESGSKNIMRRASACVLGTVLVALVGAGCSSVQPIAKNSDAASRTLTAVTPFSIAAGNALPAEWKPFIMSRMLNRTDYRIVLEEGKPVLQARAESAASGLLQDVSINPLEQRYLSWRWKAPTLIADADNARRGRDDAPVRVIVAFDGDRKKLDFEDRAFADMVKLFSGREMPYATLQYIWENKLPVDTLLENANTGRAKMIVVESGAARVGQWLTFTRDVVEDYRRAYGEEPGNIISVGVMTDSNATGSNVTAFYGDISLHAAQLTQAALPSQASAPARASLQATSLAPVQAPAR
jgi:hypothetical protein